jgi:AGZA family xanthine/uracil permease-like MFS transporter
MGLSRYLALPNVTVNVGREVVAGITTFLSMAYILFVNPLIVGSGFQQVLMSELGVSSPGSLAPQYVSLVNEVKVGIATATAFAAAFGTLLMALYARLPFAMAPGMGENGFIAFSVLPAFAAALHQFGVVGAGAAQVALMVAITAVLVDGLIFLLTAWSGVRERIINSIPVSLRYGISVGIGLFITFIGLSLSGLVVPGSGTPVSFNAKALSQLSTILALLGFFAASYLYLKRVPGAFLITIIALTLIGIALGLVSVPGNVLQVPSFSTSIIPNAGDAFRWYVNIISIAFPVAFALWIVEFFDGIGTITGLSAKAGLIDERGRPVGIGRALYTDATGTVVGALAGTTTTVIYVESATGIESGGRSGLTSLVTGLLFLAFMPLAPLAVVVPDFATAPVLMLIGLLFMSLATRVDFSDLTEAIPAFVAIIGIPLTYSIATGIGLAFITHTALKVLTGRFRELTVTTYLVTLVFIIYFIMSTML